MDDWKEIITRHLDNFEADTKLFIIHPHFLQQHLVLSALLDTPDVLYVRFEGADLTCDFLRTQFRSVMNTKGERDKIAWLILDECDRALPEELSAFLKDLFETTGDERIIVLTRTVPTFIQQNEALRDRTRFVPTDAKVMLPDYAHSDTNQTLLEISAFGGGRVLLNGQSIDNWDGTLPRALFFYMVDRGMTTRNQIFDTFWPNLSIREATNVFHVTKRKISEVLNFDLTKYWSGFYHVTPGIGLNYDVAAFAQLVTDSAVASQEKAASLLSQAVMLYKNHFLISMEMPWVQRRREELRLGYGEALASLARIREMQGEKEEALGLYIRASVTNPQREDIARSIMSLYAERGMIADAEETYQRLERELEQTLGVSPAKETQELMGHLRRDSAPPV